MTTKIALGAVVMRVPAVTDLDHDPLELIETGDWVIVDGDSGTVELEKRAAHGRAEAQRFFTSTDASRHRLHLLAVDRQPTGRLL